MSKIAKPTATTCACKRISYGNVKCFALCALMQYEMFAHVAGVESTFDINGGIYVAHVLTNILTYIR